MPDLLFLKKSKQKNFYIEFSLLVYFNQFTMVYFTEN